MKSLLILIAFSLLECAVQELTPDPVCGTDPGSSRGIKLSVNGRRNQTGDWVDIFTARGESNNLSDRINLDVTANVVECQGRRVIYIQGVLQGKHLGFSEENEKTKEKLAFHPRCGRNVVILPNGRTVQKLELDTVYNSSVFTNQPLKDDEIFEAKFEKKNEKLSNSIAIGVITRNPNDIDILQDMFNSPFAQVYLYEHIYSNGTIIVNSYGKDIQNLQVGDTVGVMRSQYGSLHFFINGVDQGPALSNMPSPVYGILDLRGTVSMATIVDASS